MMTGAPPPPSMTPATARRSSTSICSWAPPDRASNSKVPVAFDRDFTAIPSSSSKVVLWPKTAPPYWVSFCNNGSPMAWRVSRRASSSVSYSSFAAAARRVMDSSSRRRRVRSASASASSSLTPVTDFSSPVNAPRRMRRRICSSRSPCRCASAPANDSSASSAPRSTRTRAAPSAATRASSNADSRPANRSAKASSVSRARASVSASTARRTSSIRACSSACLAWSSWRAGRALIVCAACIAASYSPEVVRSFSFAASRIACASSSSAGISTSRSPPPSPLSDQPAIISARTAG